ncbi:MAG: indolepyruvate ferredoxin oxidoreductase family protein [Proteobacteria bacterium]|nr:indolepyruvate ferredoxin oxidoreductase family protein [Pseudomonadota bacterium]
MPGSTPRNLDWTKRFLAHTGEAVHLTGLQALARLPLDQIRRDRQSGLRMGGLISGYPGSPLAGFDQVLSRIRPLLEEHDLHFQLGLNEELAAAAVSGSQFLDLFPHTRFDGAIGLWYGKAPGVDRCLDVFRHANFAGVSRFGGALAVAGDDPACKSSSLPSQSEHAFAHALIPLLVPAGSAEVLEFGLHGYALSRFAGLWVGMKVVPDLCDGGEIVTLPTAPAPGPAGIRLPVLEDGGREFERRLDLGLLPPTVLEIERHLVYARLEAARRYVYDNELDRIDGRAGDRIGLVAAGTHRRELLSALERLGIDASARERLGLRILHLAMIHPVEPRRLREFARGLELVVVLDDRREFLEQQVRAILYDEPSPPRVLGHRDAQGRPWLAARGALEAEGLARDLGPLLAERTNDDDGVLARRCAALEAQAVRREAPLELVRQPHFCSGCPHLTSTRIPAGTAAAGGIGCHTMALLTGREMRFVGAMGSEGAPWNGLAPFVDTPHLFQNLGDGTYFHSGRQAIRACVAVGSPITFKLLYNGSIAMTGGQSATGEKALAPLIGDLLSDGVRRVVAMSDDPAVARLARSDQRVEVITRDDSEDGMARLAREAGVTVFVYDAICANEKQRRQRRGLLPAPSRRIFIQRDVCEGCGDCGRKSECPSVHPVETALGRKTTIHQGSCAQDDVCLAGDCPAFMTLDGDAVLESLPIPQALSDCLRGSLPEPELPSVEGVHSILMIGVGSTGVVTVDAILVGAALREGLHARHLDQTGLSQRGGRVSSHLRLSRTPVEGSGRVPRGGADVLLAFDPLGAADPQGLAFLSNERTCTVVHEQLTPTAEMVSRPEVVGPSLSALRERLARHSRELHSLAAEEIATALLGDHRGANVLLLGFAFQRGAIPLRSESIEGAIRDHGIAADANLAAFRLGRALAEHPEEAELVLRAARPASIGEEGRPGTAFDLFGGLWQEIEALLGRARDPESAVEHRVLLAGWSADLREYQNHPYGARYLRALLPLLREEVALGGDSLPLTAVAARELYRLMAYKDEYEVARLHLRGPYRRWLDRRAGRGGRARPTTWLHPPLLREWGLARKLRLGPWFEPVFQVLAALRFLRGTALDPFGRSEVRRVERELVVWYEDVLCELTERLRTLGIEAATRIAGHAGAIRGYEAIKLR